MEQELIAAFETFKFKLGDIVTLKADKRLTVMVVERYLIESPEGIARCYILRGWQHEGPIYEMEIEGPLVPAAAGGFKHHSRNDVA